MKTPALPVLIVALAGTILSATAQTTNEMPAVIEPGAKLEKLAGDFSFTEGPTCDASGNVFFTDQPNDRIVKWSAADGKFTDWLKPCGRSNGLCFDASGNLIACADEKNELWSIDVKTKQHTVLIKDYQGKLLNAPNDVWCRADGGIYITDPWYKRDYWKRGPQEQDAQAVYYVSPEGKVTRARVFPLTCTTTETVSATHFAVSNSGQGANATDSRCPSLCQSSSAKCGAKGASSLTKTSTIKAGTDGLLSTSLTKIMS